jgi:streptomycin 6-kinase
MSVEVDLPEEVRRKAEARGAEGLAWLERLEALTEDLAAQWGLTLGGVLGGGTEALVMAATTDAGEAAVLKIPAPGEGRFAGELAVLRAAKGRGYARVLAHDERRGAMLLERLGPQLAQLGLPVQRQIEIICATLKEAWATPPAGGRLTSGAEKAESLAGWIEEAWPKFGRPCSERAVEMALAFAGARAAAFDPARAVLAHGDAHAWNTLMVPGGESGRFKFIDPDGLFIEPAYDLAIPMREWGAELLAGDALALGRARCAYLARLTGVDPAPIWQWGFIERITTGLVLKEIGMEALAREFFAVADLWAAGDG